MPGINGEFFSIETFCLVDRRKYLERRKNTLDGNLNEKFFN